MTLADPRARKVAVVNVCAPDIGQRRRVHRDRGVADAAAICHGDAGAPLTPAPPRCCSRSAHCCPGSQGGYRRAQSAVGARQGKAAGASAIAAATRPWASGVMDAG